MSAVASGDALGDAATTSSVATGGPQRRRRAGSGVLRAVLGNKKALVGTLLLILFVAVAAVPQLFTSVGDPNQRAFELSLPPSGAHLLGTTSYGQDIWAQLIWGTRQSLAVALLAGVGASVIAVIIGVSAAYLGGVADNVLSTFTDIFLVLPTLPLIIIIAAYAGGSGFWVITAILVATGWSYGARQLRAQALSLRNRDFLAAARVRGERRAYIIVVEVLPNMVSLIAANFLGAALYAVLTAAGLQYIGLGNNSAVSWGTMLYWGKSAEALQTGQSWWIVAPGLCIALLGAAFALVNYAFDEIGNPALRPVRRRRRGR